MKSGLVIGIVIGILVVIAIFVGVNSLNEKPMLSPYPSPTQSPSSTSSYESSPTMGCIRLLKGVTKEENVRICNDNGGSAQACLEKSTKEHPSQHPACDSIVYERCQTICDELEYSE